MTLQQFMNTWQGKKVPSRGGITGQCVSLVQKWSEDNGITGAPVFPVASAFQMAGTRADAFTWVANTPTGVPSPGDIVVWNNRVGGGHGHTGVVVSANLNTLDVFQQNDPMGSGAYTKRYTYANVLGWLKFKNQVKQGGDIMDTNAGKELYRTGLHREAENDGVAAQWNGKRAADALSVLRTSEEWKTLDAGLKSLQSLQAQVTELNTKVNTLTAENAALKKQNDDLKAQLAAQGNDSANLNALGKLLQWILVRLGLK